MDAFLDEIFVGWDQSLNHGGVVAIGPDMADYREIVCHYLVGTDKAAVPRGSRGIPGVLPGHCRTGRKKGVDPDVVFVAKLAFLEDWFFQVCMDLAGRAATVYVAMEDFAYGATQGAHQLGAAAGIARVQMFRFPTFRLRLHDPDSLKLYGTGRGDATKHDVMDAVEALGFSPDAYGEEPAEDLADAHVLAQMVRTEVAIRKGLLRYDDLAPHHRQIMIRVTKSRPEGVCTRPWIRGDLSRDPL